MEAPQQTLPAVEPGHAIPKELKLPKVEGEGVRDAPGDPDYPKMVPHPVHGTVKATSAEHEAQIAADIAELPPPAPPTADDERNTKIEQAIGRPMTDAEKDFIDELEAASRKPPVQPSTADVPDTFTAGGALAASPAGVPVPVPEDPTQVAAKAQAAAEAVAVPVEPPASEPPAEIIDAVDALDKQAEQASQQGTE